MNIVLALLRALVSTIILESLFAIIFIKNRKVYDLVVVALINVITNPVVNYVHLLYIRLNPNYGFERYILIAVLEMLVVLVEWKLFENFIEKIQHPFWFALGINAFSFGIGSLLQFIW